MCCFGGGGGQHQHRGAVLGASAPCIRKGGCVHGAFHQARCLDLWCSGDGILYVGGGSAKWGRVKGGRELVGVGAAGWPRRLLHPNSQTVRQPDSQARRITRLAAAPCT